MTTQALTEATFEQTVLAPSTWMTSEPKSASHRPPTPPRESRHPQAEPTRPTHWSKNG